MRKNDHKDLIPDHHLAVEGSLEFLPKEELAAFDSTLFEGTTEKDKLKARVALVKSYVDVRKLAIVASGLGERGFTSF